MVGRLKWFKPRESLGGDPMRDYSYILLFAILCVGTTFHKANATGPEIFAPRGITITSPYRAQQNTLDAIMAVKRWNLDRKTPKEHISGVEVHVVVTAPANPSQIAFVCSHDENLKDLTGLDIDLRTLSKDAVRDLRISRVLDGIDYGRTRPFALFDDVLDAVMVEEPPFKIWLGVKDASYRPKQGASHTATELVRALQQWRAYYLQVRGVDIFQHILVSSTNPYIVDALDKESKARQLANQLEILPDYSDFGVHELTPAMDWFIDHGGFEQLFNLQSRWVSLEDTFISASRIQAYHDKKKKVIGWGNVGPDKDYYGALDVVLGDGY